MHTTRKPRLSMRAQVFKSGLLRDAAQVLRTVFRDSSCRAVRAVLAPEHWVPLEVRHKIFVRAPECHGTKAMAIDDMLLSGASVALKRLGYPVLCVGRSTQDFAALGETEPRGPKHSRLRYQGGSAWPATLLRRGPRAEILLLLSRSMLRALREVDLPERFGFARCLFRLLDFTRIALLAD